MRLHPFRVGLETPPGIARQQSLAEPHLLRAGESIGRVPRGSAPRTTMRRGPEGMLFGVDLPDPLRSVSVTCRTIQHAGPEHEPLHFLSIGVQAPFVADLADQEEVDRK